MPNIGKINLIFPLYVASKMRLGEQSRTWGRWLPATFFIVSKQGGTLLSDAVGMIEQADNIIILIVLTGLFMMMMMYMMFFLPVNMDMAVGYKVMAQQ